MTEIKNPCIGICKYDDYKICIGCNRTMEETANWKNYSIKEKQKVLKNTKKKKNQNKTEINTYDYFI